MYEYFRFHYCVTMGLGRKTKEARNVANFRCKVINDNFEVLSHENKEGGRKKKRDDKVKNVMIDSGDVREPQSEKLKEVNNDMSEVPLADDFQLIIKMEGDGNCLFRSLYSKQTYFTSVRKRVVNHIKTNWNDYSNFIITHKQGTYDGLKCCYFNP